MKKWYLVLSILIVIVGFSLRLWRFAERSPFDWDQNRDYQVISTIASGKITLIGPVAKGEGGFFLGPLYYYLATPAFMFLHGNPRALPLTSITLDMLAVIAMLALLPKTLGKKQTLLLAALWSTSWFTIEMSRISWNVALIPLWSVSMLWLLSGKEKLSPMKVIFLGFMAGLTWHVHAALIPLTPLIILLLWRKLGLNWRAIPLLLIGYGIPLLPLIFFDLRHAGLERYLITSMFTASTQVHTAVAPLLTAMIIRLGKNTEGLLLGISAYNAYLGFATLLAGVLGLFAPREISKVAGLFIIINFLAVFGLHEPGFPEYYFAAAYIPTLILGIYFLTVLVRNRYCYTTLAVMILIVLNVRKYSFAETSFALSQKEHIASVLFELKKPVDLHLELAPGREGGILPLYLESGGVVDEKSPVKVLVTDKSEGPLYINGELATVIGNFGGMRLAKVVVE